MNEQEANAITLKLILIWIGTFIGSVTLNQLVLGATLVFTILQIFMILRRIWKGLP